MQFSNSRHLYIGTDPEDPKIFVLRNTDLKPNDRMILICYLDLNENQFLKGYANLKSYLDMSMVNNYKVARRLKNRKTAYQYVDDITKITNAFYQSLESIERLQNPRFMICDAKRPDEIKVQEVHQRKIVKVENFDDLPDHEDYSTDEELESIRESKKVKVDVENHRKRKSTN
jgi:hypothetical protein